MTPAEHYTEAERLLGMSVVAEDWQSGGWLAAVAQIHATLAVSVRPILINLGPGEFDGEVLTQLAAAIKGEPL